MKTSEVILVAVTNCWGDVDCELTKTFDNADDANAYAAKQIREISDTNGDYISDDEVENCLDDGSYVCDSDNNIRVNISSITHYSSNC